MRNQARRLKAASIEGTRRAAQAFIERTGNSVWERDNRDNAAMRLLLAFLLRPEDNCVDVGAHSGSLVREMLRYAPDGEHVAFEPIPRLARQLSIDFPQVTVHNAAVSDTGGKVSFVYVPEAPGYSGLRRREYPVDAHPEEITVKAVTLDEALSPAYAPRLIKIDVEGAELQVLRGALRTLERHQPTLVLEHGKGAADHYGATPGQLFDLLAAVGYRVYDMDGRSYTRAELEAIFEANSVWNFVAHP